MLTGGRVPGLMYRLMASSVRPSLCRLRVRVTPPATPRRHRDTPVIAMIAIPSISR